MNKVSLTLIGLALCMTFVSCKRKEGCTDIKATNYDAKAKHDDGTCKYAETKESEYSISFSFKHDFDGTTLDESLFNNLIYTTEFGHPVSFTTMQYLVSDIRLYKSDGDSVMIDGYQFVDLKNTSSLIYTPSTVIPEGDYTGIGLIFGFTPADNITGAYPDLNAASWSWPVALGGGYHFMKMEGRFIDSTSDTLTYAYHMGTASNTSLPTPIYEDNEFLAQVAGSGFTINSDTQIEIKMNLAEWFKNPNSWDLDAYHSVLMPNYTAQIMMNENGRDVFTRGNIIQYAN